MNKKKKISNAVEILHWRYIKDDPNRKAALEAERVNAEVARMIYELRCDAGMNQKELADLIGTTQSVISRLEDADYEGHSLSMLRRVAISAYEAEMNIVIYTDGGELVVKVEPGMITLEAKDNGPGIPDVEQAMTPGYSTAAEWVRELGFGAGMGLCNIKECADEMHLDSVVGKGTHLEAKIAVEAR